MPALEMHRLRLLPKLATSLFGAEVRCLQTSSLAGGNGAAVQLTSSLELTPGAPASPGGRPGVARGCAQGGGGRPAQPSLGPFGQVLRASFVVPALQYPWAQTPLDDTPGTLRCLFSTSAAATSRSAWLHARTWWPATLLRPSFCGNVWST